MSKTIKISVALAGIAIVTIVGACLIYNPDKSIDASDSTYQPYTVEDGTSPTEVITDLKNQGYIKSSKYALKLIGDNQVYANTYGISKSMTTTQIVDIITNPVSNAEGTVGCKLVIPEGSSVVYIANQISSCSNYSSDQVLTYLNDEVNLEKYIQEYWFLTDEILNPDIKYPLEGYIAPGTYIVTENLDIEDIVKMLLDGSEKYFSEFKDSKFLDKYTFHQILTLSSIIERETINDSDKPKVSEVFYNRIAQDMPLQSDITVLYAMQEQKEKVTYEDLEYDSPYNTYLYTGLPPGPIANSSTKSIEAAINPEKSDNLYFFADQNGNIYYSKTYDEHLKITQEYAWDN